MIVKTIKYHDYDGNEREDDFYFHLNQVELTKLNGEVPGGLQDAAARATKNGDMNQMLKLIDLMISRSYGVRLPDGSFVKRNASGLPLYETFVNTEAYDNLLTELIKSEDVMVEFMTGCMTKDAQDRIRAEWAKRQGNNDQEVKLTPVSGSVK